MREMCFFCDHEWETRYRFERRCPECGRQDWHIAHYGAVAIQRAFCPVCREWTLVVDAKTSCCGTRLETEESLPQHRQTEARSARRQPSKRDQALILAAQDYKCYYCEAPFDDTTLVTWDHVVPFSYSGNNHRDNFVAACQFCNSKKSASLTDLRDGLTPKELRALAKASRNAMVKNLTKVTQRPAKVTH